MMKGVAPMHAPIRLKSSRGTLKRIAQSWQLYVLILPAIVYIFLFNYEPMYGVQIAFRDFRINRGITGSPWAGLKHFARFVQYPDFWNIMRNTAVISLYSFATFPISILFALFLNELTSERYKKTVQMITYMPHFISMVVICEMIDIFFGRSDGFVNNILELLGHERVAFLESGRYFASVYVWSDVWQEMGWGAIIYIAALANVSPELIEGVREAIDARELKKIAVLQNFMDYPKEVAQTLAERTRSEVVQVIGKKIVLYKESRDHKKIQLPK